MNSFPVAKFPIKTTVLHPTSATDMIHDDGHLQGLLSEPSLPDMNGRDGVDFARSPWSQEGEERTVAHDSLHMLISD
jgi:hypothetical protein